jgi:hypothetical protein
MVRFSPVERWREESLYLVVRPGLYWTGDEWVGVRGVFYL